MDFIALRGTPNDIYPTCAHIHVRMTIHIQPLETHSWIHINIDQPQMTQGRKTALLLFLHNRNMSINIVMYYASFHLATFVCLMSPRFGTCVSHSANSIVMETLLESLHIA